ncbi:MAG: ecdysteroid 22-kinase family protein [Candidatus Bathyarchaeota archaeon]|nr:ecdysteroid 22-kinase family protein [Candidatus Bathyarchaeum sp.]
MSDHDGYYDDVISDIITKEMRINDLTFGLESLYGGYSDSRLFRVKAQMYFSPFKDRMFDFPKIVIKINTRNGFAKEARTYSNVPKKAKCLLSPVNLEGTKSVKNSNFYYLIMEDLAEYDTLYSIICRKRVDKCLKDLFSDVFQKLSKFYDCNKKENQFGVVSRLYLGKIQEISRGLKTRTRKEKILSNTSLKKLQEFSFCLSSVVKQIEPPFTTLSHGDLNARNIMIRENDFDVKLIDLFSLNNFGDYVYDLGQLLCNLTEVLPITETYPAQIHQIDSEKLELSKFVKKILYEEIKKVKNHLEDKDEFFELRLELAQVRFLLNCALRSDKIRATAFAEKGVEKFSSFFEKIREIS